MSFPRYRAYKDSGVEWLGEVPEHWEATALKRLAFLKSGESINSIDIEEEGQYPVYGGNGRRGYTPAFTHEGTFALIGRQGALCGNINYAEGRFWASEHAIVITPRVPLATRWLGELLRAMNLNQYSISAAQPGLSVEMVANLRVPRPSYPEQSAIATFLDRETAKIDALMAEYRTLIELLNEKRQAVISHAVTKGMDPTVPMKDSGVEWLGEVPEHWTVCALSYRYLVDLGKMLDEKKITGEHLALYLRNVDVQWGKINVDDLPEMDFAGDDLARYSLKQGDLLTCEGGECGRSAIWNGALQECYYQKALHRLRAKCPADDTPWYLLYVLWSAANRGVLSELGGRSTIAHLPAEAFRRYRFPFPPQREQTAIATFLDRETNKIDSLTAEAGQGIAILQERRTALISAAVTGKIDVRGLVSN
jgi:type I restriction enzyme S subunit